MYVCIWISTLGIRLHGGTRATKNVKGFEGIDALTGGMEVKDCSMRRGANPSSTRVAYTCKRRFWTTFLLPFERAIGVGGGGVEFEIDVCDIGRKKKIIFLTVLPCKKVEGFYVVMDIRIWITGSKENDRSK